MWTESELRRGDISKDSIYRRFIDCQYPLFFPVLSTCATCEDLMGQSRTRSCGQANNPSPTLHVLVCMWH
jgi:hypothetical protein